MHTSLKSLITAAAILSGMAAPVYAPAATTEAPTPAATTDAPTPVEHPRGEGAHCGPVLPLWGRSDEAGIIHVPDSVTEIPPYAFADRKDIKAILFSNASQCETIGEYAFLGCEALADLQLPESVKSLGEGCFQECRALKSVRIPDKVTALPKELFRECEGLEEVLLPANLTDIGSRAFIYCPSLKKVASAAEADKARTLPAGAVIPEGVEHIGSNAFGHCAALERVELPGTIKELESYAFAECRSLREARLPANDNLLGELMFSGCVSLTDLYEPSLTPPLLDCNSTIFEPDENELYLRCRLHVPPGAESAYAAAPAWRHFRHITPEKPKKSRQA